MTNDVNQRRRGTNLSRSGRRAAPLISLVLLAGLAAGCGDPAPEADPDTPPDASTETQATDAPPATDLYAIDLTTGPDGFPELGEPRNLTRRALYDNQPFFLPDGERILYTAGREDGGTDTHVLDLGTGESRPLMVTEETSEYSPTPVPGRGVVVVRVEEDGSTQRLWRFDLEPDAGGVEGDRAELLLPDVEPVGYHGWLDPGRVAMYVLGSPASLHLAEVDTDFRQLVFEGVGPSVQKIPGETAVSFVEMGEEGVGWIRRLDGATGSTTRLIETVGAGSDHAWTPDGVLLMASGDELLAARPDAEGADAEWRSLGRIGPEGIAWSRIAVSPSGTRMVLVGATPGSSP